MTPEQPASGLGATDEPPSPGETAPPPDRTWWHEVPDGFAVLHDGQVYRLVGVRDYERVDGTNSAVLTWESDCPECGAVFAVTMGKMFREPRRRCEACVRPGSPVSGYRRRPVRRGRGAAGGAP